MSGIKVRNLKQVISRAIGEDFEITKENQKLLTEPGEHYGSIMLAIDITIKRTRSGEEEELNLVGKLIPASDLLRAMFDVQVTFRKEISAYLDAVPAMNEFQRKHNCPEWKIIDLFPKCYGARINLNDNGEGEVDEDAVIILENLKAQGYDTGDRFVGLDLANAKLIVEDLAKFHAIPIAMRLLEPDLFDKHIAPCTVQNSCFDKIPEEVGSAFHNSIMDGAKQVPELQPFLDRVQKGVDKAMDELANKVEPRELFATAIHADYWLSNTMILRDENGKPIKNKIVDLQIMQYDSCARDLIFFLFTSVVNSVLDDHYDELVRLYYDSFIQCLKDFHLDVERYTWEVFQEELEIIGPKEFYHVGFMLKPITTEKGKVKSFEGFQTSDWCRKDLLGDAHKRKLKDTVLAFAKRNWI